MSDTGGKDQELAFAAEFPSASREQWLKLAADVLKGAAFEERLKCESLSSHFHDASIEPGNVENRAKKVPHCGGRQLHSIQDT